MCKVRKAIKSSENFPMDSLVHIVDFLLGRQEKICQTKNEKAVTAVQLTKEDKVIRMYI